MSKDKTNFLFSIFYDLIKFNLIRMGMEIEIEI